MKILALESSAKASSVAYCADGKLTAQYFQDSGLTHSKTLLSMTEDMLKNLGLKVSDMDAIAVAIGPGSFTGIRIGVAAAKGLAWGADKPVCGVSTLEAMSYAMADRGGLVCPLMDARRGQVYNALFHGDDGKLTRLCEDRAISIEELIGELRERDGPCYLVGDGAEMFHGALVAGGIDAVLAPPQLIMQSAWGVARAAFGAEPIPAKDLVPNYLRLSQAERERMERGKNINNRGERGKYGTD